VRITELDVFFLADLFLGISWIPSHGLEMFGKCYSDPSIGQWTKGENTMATNSPCEPSRSSFRSLSASAFEMKI